MSTPVFDDLLKRIDAIPEGGCEHCGHKWLSVPNDVWDEIEREYDNGLGNWFVYKNVTAYREGTRPETEVGK